MKQISAATALTITTEDQHAPMSIHKYRTTSLFQEPSLLSMCDMLTGLNYKSNTKAIKKTEGLLKDPDVAACFSF